MKKIGWRSNLVLSLLLLSALIYYIHYLIFRDVHHIFLYLIGDIAFVFLQVLMVTLFVEKLLEEREKSALLKKLNMVIGAFFSEAGTSLLKMLSSFDPSVCEIRSDLSIDSNWSKSEFTRVCKQLDSYQYKFHCSREDLVAMKDYLLEKRVFFLRLLENPNLLEHESFTELLWAVFHLTDELAARKDLIKLQESDFNHLLGDINRVYAALTRQWLSYMDHLRLDYPFLFSFAMRTNPFNPEATVEITE